MLLNDPRNLNMSFFNMEFYLIRLKYSSLRDEMWGNSVSSQMEVVALDLVSFMN